MNHVDKIIPLSACVTRVYGIAHVLVIVVVVTAHGGGKYGGDGADGADAGDGTRRSRVVVVDVRSGDGGG